MKHPPRHLSYFFPPHFWNQVSRVQYHFPEIIYIGEAAPIFEASRVCSDRVHRFQNKYCTVCWWCLGLFDRRSIIFFESYSALRSLRLVINCFQLTVSRAGRSSYKTRIPCLLSSLSPRCAGRRSALRIQGRFTQAELAV